MNWTQASVVLDRFSRHVNENLDHLKRLCMEIRKFEAQKNYERAAYEKDCAKKHIKDIQQTLQQVVSMRSKLEPDLQTKFDARMEPMRNRINQTLLIIAPRLNDHEEAQEIGDNKDVKQWPFKPEKSTNPFDVNYFEDCFDEERAQQTADEYEVQLRLQEQKMYDETKHQELKMKAEQARMDAEATKKLAQDIEDLDQIMTDLNQLVHSQGEIVDSIEDQVEHTFTDVKKANKDLKQAARHNQAKIPVVAAVVGSLAAGGPVGVVAGSAVAGVAAAVGGAIAGLYSGRWIKKKAAEDVQ